MNVHRTHSKSKKSGKTYGAVLLRDSYREGGKVKNRTIANLTHCKEEEIHAIEFALKHKKSLPVLGSINESVELKEGLRIGAAWTVYCVAKEMGIERALGTGREGKLALWQVIARVIEQGSRLSATRLARTTAACDILGLSEGFDENALYDNLKWLSEKQENIEQKLLKIRRQGSAPELFLYDVTSSYLEGQCNELGDWGYNRDKKKGKKQLVVGLLCDEWGEPVSVQVFAGNTNDVTTFGDQVTKASQKYGCLQVTFVGDRGMIKRGQIDELKKVGFYYITAITKPQIRTLLRSGTFQVSLFEEKLCEVVDDGTRYVLRRNPIRADEIKANRLGKLKSVEAMVTKLDKYLKDSPKASVDLALEKVNKKISKLGIKNWLKVSKEERQLRLLQDEEALSREAELDGCYALKTDLPASAASFDVIHGRYKDLGKVEQAFRTGKTGLLELRPWFVWTQESTQGHALVVMLAYLIVKKLQTAWANLDTTVEEGLRQLSSLSSIEVAVTGAASFHQIPTPREMSAKLLQAASVRMPKYLPNLGAKVVTRKNISKPS
jgi:transposase